MSSEDKVDGSTLADVPREQTYNLGGGILLECQDCPDGELFRVVRAQQGVALICSACGMTYGFNVVLPMNAKRAFVDRKGA